MARGIRRLRGAMLVLAVIGLAAAAPASAKLGVTWMKSYAAPGTPAKYNKVGVIKVGKPRAKNVLIFEPGTSAGAAYFVPLAKWITSTAPGWQVWSVERRENLLEDQSVLNKVKAGKATVTQMFNYYLGFLKDPSISPHFQFISDSTVEFAKNWGMKVAVEDLHTVITAAHKLGGKVVLGGHSLGGSVVTAYATWNFGGHPGADQLSGLVFDDGGSFRNTGHRGRGPDRAGEPGTPPRPHPGWPSAGSPRRSPGCTTPPARWRRSWRPARHPWVSPRACSTVWGSPRRCR